MKRITLFFKLKYEEKYEKQYCPHPPPLGVNFKISENFIFFFFLFFTSILKRKDFMSVSFFIELRIDV